MKEQPIIMIGKSIRAILADRKTQTRRVVTPHNSICGVGKVDWDKFDFEGKSIHISKCFEPNCRHQHKYKAPLPFQDGTATQQYLHVPFNWAEDMTVFRLYPKYEVGDRLWVRETFYFDESVELREDGLFYKADEWMKQIVEDNGERWQSPIFMPRWASRILLEITEVRVERLQEITRGDIRAEGVGIPVSPQFTPGKKPNESELHQEFANLWDSLNGKKYPWEANPWVWVISFRRVK